jgi:hypothetical protein
MFVQVASPLMLPVRFLHLKEFNLSLTGQGVSEAYDYFSLASLLDSCPSLRNIFLNVSRCQGISSHYGGTNNESIELYCSVSSSGIT